MHNHPVKNLRICVTEKCNLKCFFCHSEWNPASNYSLEPREISRIVEVASSLGINGVKITGGEPLLRNDIVEIVKMISPLTKEVSLVTNGILLEDYASDLKNAGLSRVNVNLPSLIPSKYRNITGGGDIDKVFNGINAAIEADLTPLKINMVVLKGVNDDEVEEMMDYACSIGAILQLIELQPIPGDKQVFENFHMSLREFERLLESKSIIKTLNNTGQRNIYIIPKSSDKAVVEIVSPVGNSNFCSKCSKLRVTCDGRLKPCLLRNDNLISILELVRSEEYFEALKEKFIEAIAMKEPYWKNNESLKAGSISRVT
ncbi:MAG: GTP 3',8-cyclase MoaA [Candidatus Brockarchaeota archaeon]|nr:GTP 3',8-cyclase MoaA [Candidatus Brockarchaeota archaeon]